MITSPTPELPHVGTDTPPPPATNSGSPEPPTPGPNPFQTSPSPSPPPVTAAAPQPAAPNDSPVATLKAMFPDYDDIVLQSILESVNYDQDRALDTLLGMSDPNYKPSPAEIAQQNASSGQVTQSDLDEQMARQLYMDDQRQYQTAQRAQQQGPRHGGWGPGVHPQSPPPPGQEKDTMAEISEQVNKFAETGKKTFQSLFSQAKAKVQEFQNSQNRTPGTENDQYLYQGSSGQGSSQQRQQSTHGFAPSPDQPAGYTPPPPSQAQPYETAEPAAPSRPQVDGSKIGMLPKRPVSLLRPSSEMQAPAAAASSTSPPHADGQSRPAAVEREDSLEYVENPFEDESSKRR